MVHAKHISVIVPVLISAILVSMPAPARSGGPDFIYPVIENYGGVVSPKGLAEQPQKGSKVLFDIMADEEAGKVAAAIDRVALFLNLYAAAGVPPDQIAVALVLHGDATRAALSDEGYARKTGGKGNPNLKLLHLLKKNGVELYVCRQALAYHGWSPDLVAPMVTIAAAAATVVVDKQRQGYAYIPFH